VILDEAKLPASQKASLLICQIRFNSILNFIPIRIFPVFPDNRRLHLVKLEGKLGSTSGVVIKDIAIGISPTAMYKATSFGMRLFHTQFC
jgi:hypothetical protein